MNPPITRHAGVAIYFRLITVRFPQRPTPETSASLRRFTVRCERVVAGQHRRQVSAPRLPELGTPSRSAPAGTHRSSFSCISGKIRSANPQGKTAPPEAGLCFKHPAPAPPLTQTLDCLSVQFRSTQSRHSVTETTVAVKRIGLLLVSQSPCRRFGKLRRGPKRVKIVTTGLRRRRDSQTESRCYTRVLRGTGDAWPGKHLQSAPSERAMTRLCHLGTKHYPAAQPINPPDRGIFLHQCQ